MEEREGSEGGVKGGGGMFCGVAEVKVKREEINQQRDWRCILQMSQYENAMQPRRSRDRKVGEQVTGNLYKLPLETGVKSELAATFKRAGSAKLQYCTALGTADAAWQRALQGLMLATVLDVGRRTFQSRMPTVGAVEKVMVFRIVKAVTVFRTRISLDHIRMMKDDRELGRWPTSPR